MEADDLVPHEVAGIGRRRSARQIFIRGVEGPARSAEPDCHQRLVGDRPDPHCEIGLAPPEIDGTTTARDFELDPGTDAWNPASRSASRALSPLGKARRTGEGLPRAASTKAVIARSKLCPAGNSRSPNSVSAIPSGRRASNDEPSACSNAATCRLTVEWRTPSSRAAADKLPARATARKLRMSFQSSLPIPHHPRRHSALRHQAPVRSRTRPCAFRKSPAVVVARRSDAARQPRRAAS